MMKKENKKEEKRMYQTPFLEVIEIAKEDVITTSGLGVEDNNQNENPDEWGKIWS